MSQHLASLTRRSSARRPARSERVAVAVLAMLACALAHEATYLISFGGGASFAAAMRTAGHDGYWPWLAAAVAVATAGLVVVTTRQLLRLHREAALTPTIEDPDGPRSYLRLTLGIWARVALIAGLFYTLQENAEALAVGLPVQGVDVVLRHGVLPLVLILLATLVVALVAALAHWRRLTLLGRLAAAAHAWSRVSAGIRARPGSRAPGQSRVPVFHGSRAPPAHDWSLRAAP